MITAETVVKPVNRSVIFLNEREVVLSNEFWQIAIDVTMTPYEDALSVIKGDLLEIREHRQEFTSISEISLRRGLQL